MQPRQTKNLINLRRISSYLLPAASRSGFSQASSRSKASGERSEPFFMEGLLAKVRLSEKSASHVNTQSLSEAMMPFATVGARTLLPFSLQDKACPVVRRTPLLLLPHLHLSCSEGCRGWHTILQHTPIESLHQLRCSLIVHFPEASYNPRRASIHETPHYPDQSFAFDFLS